MSTIVKLAALRSPQRHPPGRVTGCVSITTGAIAAMACVVLSLPTAAEPMPTATIAEGRALAFNRTKGHCLACHEIAGGNLPGNVGPPLVSMKARYPDKRRLRAIIFDARSNNANTIMPPFGPNSLLADDEIDKVVDFIHSL
jgi:L-cysteine S-thiosulfotransferase